MTTTSDSALPTDLAGQVLRWLSSFTRSHPDELIDITVDARARRGVEALVATSRPRISAAGPVRTVVRTGPCLP
jgi:hypothetical protein